MPCYKGYPMGNPHSISIQRYFFDFQRMAISICVMCWCTMFR